MARQTLTADFWEVPITSGTLQNVGLVDIEINNAQNDDTGIVLEPSEIYQWDSATIYVRKANDNDAPCEVAYVPFKKTAEGGGGSYTLPVASASTLGGIKVGSGLSIDSDGVLTGASTYTLPTATASTLGGVKSSLDTGNIKVNADGTMTINGVQVMGYDEVAEMAMPSDVYTTLTADSSNNVIAPANGYLQVIYDIVTNNITSVGLDDYVVLIPAGFNGATDCGTELYPVSKGKTTKLNIASVISGHYTIKFIYSVGDAKALGLI